MLVAVPERARISRSSVVVLPGVDDLYAQAGVAGAGCHYWRDLDEVRASADYAEDRFRIPDFGFRGRHGEQGDWVMGDLGTGRLGDGALTGAAVYSLSARAASMMSVRDASRPISGW